jgi:hypothetical protein
LRDVAARAPGAPADPSVDVADPLDGLGLPRRRKTHLRDLQAAAAASAVAPPRSITFNIDVSDGEAQILEIPTGDDGSALGACARQALKGRRIALRNAKPGSHLLVTVPVHACARRAYCATR